MIVLDTDLAGWSTGAQIYHSPMGAAIQQQQGKQQRP